MIQYIQTPVPIQARLYEIQKLRVSSPTSYRKGFLVLVTKNLAEPFGFLLYASFQALLPQIPIASLERA